jgi:hypothetical protein
MGERNSNDQQLRITRRRRRRRRSRRKKKEALNTKLVG